jgi:hypothetical protein
MSTGEPVQCHRCMAFHGGHESWCPHRWASGMAQFGPFTVAGLQITEDDIRRIIREELEAAKPIYERGIPGLPPR